MAERFAAECAAVERAAAGRAAAARAAAARAAVQAEMDAGARAAAVRATMAASTPADSGQQETSGHTAPTRQPAKEAHAATRWRSCTSCRRAKVACVDGQRPCPRCLRIGLQCDDESIPVKAAACSHCSHSKVKCDLDYSKDSCSRCRRLGLICEPVQDKTRAKKRRSPSSGDDDSDAGASVDPKTASVDPKPASVDPKPPDTLTSASEGMQPKAPFVLLLKKRSPQERKRREEVAGRCTRDTRSVTQRFQGTSTQRCAAHASSPLRCS